MSLMPQINPPSRLLLGPGPSPVHPRVLRIMSTPLIGHLDPAFLKIMDESMAMLRHVFQTECNVRNNVPEDCEDWTVYLCSSCRARHPASSRASEHEGTLFEEVVVVNGVVVADITKLSMIYANEFEDNPIGLIYSEAPHVVLPGM